MLTSPMSLVESSRFVEIERSALCRTGQPQEPVESWRTRSPRRSWGIIFSFFHAFLTFAVAFLAHPLGA